MLISTKKKAKCEVPAGLLSVDLNTGSSVLDRRHDEVRVVIISCSTFLNVGDKQIILGSN